MNGSLSLSAISLSGEFPLLNRMQERNRFFKNMDYIR